MKRAGGCGFACLEMASQIYETASAQDACAVIVEPYQGSGVIVPPEGYLKKLQDWVKARGMLFIVDEIQSGMGPHGAFVPLSAGGAGARSSAYRKGARKRYAHRGGPLAKAACEGTSSRLCRRLRRRRSGLRGCLRGVPAAGQRSSCAREICEPDTTGRAHGAEANEHVLTCRSCGLAAAIVLRNAPTCERVHHALTQRGFLPGRQENVLFLKPPYVVTNEQILAFLAALRQELST